MFQYAKWLFMAAWIFFVRNVHSQTHLSSWFRATLSVSAGKKLLIDTEFQHKRQNGYQNLNLLNKNLMFTYRNWIQYRHSENFRFSVSPFAYFSHYRIIHNKADEQERPIREFRFSGAIDMQHTLFGKYLIVNRSAIEYRSFGNGRKDIIRMRNRMGFRHDFSERLKLGVFDELFVNLTEAGNAYFFDHNRSGVSLEYNIRPDLKLDFGYIYIIRLVPGNDKKIRENTILLNITYRIIKRTKQEPQHLIAGL